MADNQLQINIGADTRSLEQGLQRATTAVEKFDKTVNQSAAASGKAGLALSNLGRVASDAPFGFIAIQNNIEPLLQSFQSLSKESGGAGGALKALGAGLAGPTGILLAFSLVSTAITVAIQKYGSLGAATKALLGTQTELDRQVISAQKSYEKYAESIRSVNDAQAAGIATATAESTKIQALSLIVLDTTKSYNERNEALKQLKDINKDYFSDIDIESGKLGVLQGRVEQLTQARIQAAIAREFESDIAKTTKEIGIQTNVLTGLQKSAAQARARLAEFNAEQQKSGAVIPSASSTTGISVDRSTRTQEALQAAIDKANQQIEAQRQVINGLNQTNQQYTTSLNEAIQKNVQLNQGVRSVTDANKANADALKQSTAEQKKANAEAERQAEIDRKRIERLDRLMETRPTFAPIAGINLVPDSEKISLSDIDGQVKLIRDRYEQGLKPLKSIGAQIINTIPKAIDPNFRIIPPGVSQSAIDAINNIKENISLVSSAFDTVLSPAIDGAFNAIANGQSVIESLKGSLKSLLVQLAANAAKALLLKAALSFVPGSAGIIGGGLLPGGGGASGIIGALLGGGGGLPRLTGAAAPTFTGVSGFGGGLQLAGQVVFTQRGTDLVGVLNQSNARINRVG